jgi:ribosomal protein L7/L12
VSEPQPRQLPADVQAALSRGDFMGAIKLLRAASGLGLAEARALIDRQRSPAPRAKAKAGAPSATWPPGTLPPSVSEAVHAGRTIDAIRLMREHSGLGLKEAKAAVDRYAAQHREQFGPLSPGEMPRGRPRLWFFLAVVAALLWVAWRVLRRSAE